MHTNTGTQTPRSLKTAWIAKRIALLVFDIAVVNGAYFLAILMRCFIGGRYLLSYEGYLNAFLTFAPFYTAASILIFMLCGLYSSHWRFAGIADLNRIALANLLTTAVQVLGTILFNRQLFTNDYCRMPLTYYITGAIAQFILITVSRFAYRIWIMERSRLLKSRKAALNVMIVGMGETSRIVRRQIENSENAAHPVCLFTVDTDEASGSVDGLPVVRGIENLKPAFTRFGVSCVILADSLMNAQSRKQIRTLCSECNVEVQDFSGYLQNNDGVFSFSHLMELTSGKVEVLIDGVTTRYENAQQALMNVPDHMSVTEIKAKENCLVLKLNQAHPVVNDINTDWARDVVNKTGQEISFF